MINPGIKKAYRAIVLLLSFLILAVPAASQEIEWGNANGGGGETTGGGNVLKSSIGQVTSVLSVNASDNLRSGYRIAVPMTPNVECRINGGACSTSTCYGSSDGDFTFRYVSGYPFNPGASQYFQYLWQTSNSYTHTAIQSADSWGYLNALCPGGTCDEIDAGTGITVSPSGTSNTYYMIVRSYNGGQENGTPGDPGLLSSDTVLGPYQYDVSGPTISGTIDVSDTDYNNNYVDTPFDISVNGITGNGCSGYFSCEYTIDGGSNWYAGTADTGAGTCNVNDTVCTNGTSMTVNIRASDARNNTTTASSISVTCDDSTPTVTQILPTSDSYSTVTAVSSGALTCNDTYSGVHDSSAYAIQYCDDGSAKGNCDAAGTWVDGTPSGYSGTNSESFTGTDGHWYRFRGNCRDNVLNASAWSYSTGYILVDTQAPGNPTIAGYDSSAKTVTLDESKFYRYTAPTGPYFDWTAPSDLPATANSGLKGYYVYFGTNSSADPSSYQTTTNYTNTITVDACETYYFRIKTEDNAGNISSAATAFTYKTSCGSYLRVTEIDADTSDDIDGVLSPDDTDEELLYVTLYDEWDDICTTPAALAQMNVQLTITDSSGLTGAYFSDTNLGGATTGLTTIEGTLTSGVGWVKIKANGTAQNSAIKISAVPVPDNVSYDGGRNQPSYVLVKDDTNATLAVETVDYEVTPLANSTVFHPVWSHSGAEITFAMRENVGDKWNIYSMHWNGTDWDAPLRLTNNSMNVQAYMRYTYSGDDNYVIFSGMPSSIGMFAVKADGSDNAADLATIDARQRVSEGSTENLWWDSDWSKSTCSNGWQNTLLVSHADGPKLQLYYKKTGANALGLYTVADSGDFTKMTNFSSMNMAGLHPAWSNDCSKVVFSLWDSADSQAMGIYLINLTDTGMGAVASLPITSLEDTGVYKIQECTSTSCTGGSAMFPSFTADDTMVSYMVDPDKSFDVRDDFILPGFQGLSMADNLFNNENFDNYLEYILDEPLHTPQLVGQSENNEFGLVQCSGPSCPQSTESINLFSYITQKTGTTDGKLAFLELTNTSEVTSNGGLLFYQGSVTAVIPPGAIIGDEVKLQATDPVSPADDPSSPDGLDLLVQIGQSQAREFFPDGIVFNSDIRMIFHYCDANDNGKLDVNQDATCSGGGDTEIDEDEIYVYYWCENSTLGCSQDAWNKLDGSVDPDNDTITIVINHFSVYDVWALTRGRIAPAAFQPLNMVDVHTYPNPWRRGNNNVTFTADSTSSTYNTGGTILVDVQIYDIRGKLVRTLHEAHNNTIPDQLSGLTLAEWDVTNNSGRRVASGIYPYVLRVWDGVFARSYTGKLSVVK
ncbi:MAG TPA: hypothetical protein PLN69_03615 [bacterium]|nr:hypothetical protein [bacterium]